MNNLSNQTSQNKSYTGDGANQLWQYIQSLSPETIAECSQPNPEVAKIMERDLIQMLGILPPDQFDVMISTSREDLGQLLAAAMMKGYFLYNAQQRMMLEKSLH